MDPNIQALLQQLDQDPDLQAIKKQLASLEAQIKPRVSEDAWLLLLKWEAEWAQYLTLCTKRIYTLAQADEEPAPTDN